MGTNVRKRRNTSDISKLSAQTRLTAWTIYTELTRGGMDSAKAIRRALRQACPPKDDPYYRTFYANKTRELELWRKLSLWPLSKPKDIEHDTGPQGAVEVASKALGRVFGSAEGAAGFTLLLDTEGLDEADRIDTLEFDPLEVAKIIDSYEHEATLFDPDSTEPSETPLLRGSGQEFGDSPHSQPSFSFDDATVDQRHVLAGPGDVGYDQSREIPVSAHWEAPFAAACASGISHLPVSDVVGRVEFDQDTLNEVLAMVAWWKRNKRYLTESETGTIPRPSFAREHLRTRRIALDAKLWEDAEDAAREQPGISGGTLSGLVEYLLWRHLGSQEKYVKKR